MRTTTFVRFGLLALVVFLLPACTTPRQPPVPVGDLKIAVAHYTQPLHIGDMLVGYLPDNVAPVDNSVLALLDGDLTGVLRSSSSKHFISNDRSRHCARITAGPRQSALRTWSAVGRCMGADLLVVPQLIEWRERKGGEVGVAIPAKVVMDTFIIDVTNEQLISRSRYDETQSALADNLLDTGKFFKRGGKWVNARDLAHEGMEKAVKELGL